MLPCGKGLVFFLSFGGEKGRNGLWGGVLYSAASMVKHSSVEENVDTVGHRSSPIFRFALFGTTVRHRHTHRALARLQLEQRLYAPFTMPTSLNLLFPQDIPRIICYGQDLMHEVSCRNDASHEASWLVSESLGHTHYT